MLRIAGLILPTVAVLAALCHVSTAHAAGPQRGIAADRILLGGGAPAVAAVQQWKALGVQQVRVTAMWNRIPPSPRSKTRPKGFNAADPHSAGYHWTALDTGLNLRAVNGIKPILMVTGPGPYWG